APSVADEGVEKIHIGQRALERGVGLQKHESEVKGYMGVESGDADGLRPMNKMLKPAQHLAAGDVLRAVELFDNRRPDLVGPAADLERNAIAEAGSHDIVGKSARPVARASPGCEKIVVLEQEDAR